MQLREATVRARVPTRVKQEADAVFESLGISSSEAIRMFLTQVRLHQGLPFEIRLPQERDNSDLLRSASKRQAALDSVSDD